MEKEEITKQLELYSNAIIVFVVFQSLTFCYNFGTSTNFHDILEKTKWLSIGLAVLFIVAYVFALLANCYICRTLKELNGKYGQIVKTAYKGKSVVIILFAILQIGVIFSVIFSLK